MTTRIAIPRNGIAKLKELTKNIGGYISGRKLDEHGIGRVFWNTLASYLFQKIYEAYVVKSHGGTDELGNAWEPLAESTVRMKKTATSALRSSRSKEKKYLRGLKPERSHKRLIMRETDRLINSFKPSIIRGFGEYTARNDQIAYKTTRSFVIGTDVEYAKYHNSTRPVIPDNADIWVKEAIEAAVDAARERLIQVVR